MLWAVLPLLLAGAPSDSAIAADSLHVAVASAWSASASVTTYFGATQDLYAVPVAALEYHGFHIEARYNYEDFRTSAFFLGWHLGVGNEGLGFELTPMVGWVTGRTDGWTPALRSSFFAGRFELASEAEYVVVDDEEGGSFFYDRSDLIYSIPAGLSFGIVGEHTKTDEPAEREFELGFLVGASSDRLGVTFYLFSPGQEDAQGALELELAF